MPRQDQLEIITPDGAIEFYTLDHNKGTVNIGRHPDNDIVIDNPGVALFHAVIDHSRKPYHITLLSPDGETTMGGQKLSPNAPTELHNWNTVETAGYAIILLEGVGTGAAAGLAPVPAEPPPTALPTPEAAPPPATGAGGLWQKVSQSIPGSLKTILPVPTGQAPAATEKQTERALTVPPVSGTAIAPVSRVPAPVTTPFPDQSDDVVIVELSEREWNIGVEQTATCQVTITNGGGIVATFAVRVEGVAESWVTILPPQVNLNEGERTTVTVAITPPRLSSSRAGTYHTAVVVTSPNYPGRSGQQGAILEVNPYYEFAMGELSPRQQTLGGRRPVGETLLHIANKGNSEVPFRLEAMDEQHACSFELVVPGETTSLARQAEMRLPPEETFAVPIRITPISRPLVGLRNRRHSFTVTAMLLEGQLTPRSLLGQVRVRPLIGPLLLILFAVSLFTLTILIFRPRIHRFEAHPVDDFVSDGIVNPGETVRLSWQASPFTSLSIEEDWYEAGIKTRLFLEGSERQKDVTPPQDVRYTLIAENFVSDALGFIRPARWVPPIDIDVFPLQPRIVGFSLDREEIVVGQDVRLQWIIENADEVALSYRAGDNTGEILLDPVEYGNGLRQQSPQVPTTYVLCAKNDYSEDRPCEERAVVVHEPTPTPLPVPVVQRFSVTPREVYAGKNVTITWEVGNATSIRIRRSDGFEEEKKELTGDTIQTLAQLGVVKYTLTAIFDDGKGHPDGPSTRDSDEEIIIVVEQPTPTPEPQKPVIDDFRAVPSEVVRGDSGSLELVWTVSGDTTNIEISGPTLGTASNLPAKGTIPIAAGSTTFFILTAYNGDLSASQTVELTVLEPTPTPEPTATPLPAPEIVRFEAESLGTYQVTEVDRLVNRITYDAQPGARVRLRWTVLHADGATLYKGGNEIGGGLRPPDGSYEDLDPIRLQTVEYRLHAENADGVSVDHFIEIRPLDLRPPPPPHNVNGIEVPPDSLTITWQYDPSRLGDSPNEVFPLTRFRIYREDQSAPGFLPVAYADGTDCIDDPTAQCEWKETLSPVCGYGYYVTGVYEDRYGNVIETGPSPERYYSAPCPLPP